MELWDVLDAQRRPLHRTHVRGTPMKKGEYHLVVFVWIVNSRGELLLTKRSPEKETYPNLWENTGGSALAGETSLQAVRRELFEETGISAQEDELHFLGSCIGRTWISDTYLLRRDVPLEDIRFQPGETCDARWVSWQELEELIAQELVARPDVDRLRALEPVLKRELR